jgi:hypothetical protein
LLQKEHGRPVPGAQISSPPELKGQEADGAVVLKVAWNGLPHVRDPPVSSKTIEAEEHEVVGTGGKGVTPMVVGGAVDKGAVVGTGGVGPGQTMGEGEGPGEPGQENELAFEMVPRRSPRE